jgi:elongator complex protein 1
VLPHMLQFTPEHLLEARALRKDLGEFEVELRAALDTIWIQPIAEGDTLADRMAEKDRDRMSASQIGKPEVTGIDLCEVDL